MPALEWNKTYSVNIAELDEQHQRLFQLINDLDEVMQGGTKEKDLAAISKELDTIAAVLDDLVDYTIYHFSTEEDYFIEHEYPGYDQQKHEHQLFIEKIRSFDEKFHQGQAVMSRDIIEFLQQWWQKHILELDKSYGPFLNEKGLR